MKKRKGFEAITMVLLVLIVITAVYIVAYHFLPNMRLLVIAATSKMAGQLQLAVRQCQAFHEELNFLENMVDQVGVRQSMSEAGLNGGSGTINCCSKGSPGCAIRDSSPTECIKKCAALLKLYEECSKYPTPGVDCYKDAATRGKVEEGVEGAATTPAPSPTTTASVTPTATVSPTIPPTTTPPSSTFDFSLSVSPSSDSQKQHGYSTAQISVGLVSGTSQQVTLSSSVVRTSGIGNSLTPSDGYPPFSSVLGSYTLPASPVGTYEITITATGGGKTHTAKYYLTVTPGS